METVQVGEYAVEVTHTERVLFPEDVITKGHLIAYYRAVAETMLPHLQGRPLHMQRFPRGIEAEGFVQKEAPEHAPSWVTRVTVQKEGGYVTQVVCDKPATLIYLANQACITPHVWLSKVDELHHPDRMILDLDPSSADFEVVRTAARSLQSLLTGMNLPAFVMTTGSRGLHVVVPLDRSADFDRVRAFAHRIAERLVERDPDRLTLEARKEERRGRLFVDTLRNAYGATAVAPYSVRALAGAPVATPLHWTELDDPDLTSRRFTLRTIPLRLDAGPDPWRHISEHAVRLPVLPRQ